MPLNKRRIWGAENSISAVALILVVMIFMDSITFPLDWLNLWIFPFDWLVLFALDVIRAF